MMILPSRDNGVWEKAQMAVDKIKDREGDRGDGVIAGTGCLSCVPPVPQWPSCLFVFRTEKWGWKGRRSHFQTAGQLNRKTDSEHLLHLLGSYSPGWRSWFPRCCRFLMWQSHSQPVVMEMGLSRGQKSSQGNRTERGAEIQVSVLVLPCGLGHMSEPHFPPLWNKRRELNDLQQSFIIQRFCNVWAWHLDLPQAATQAKVRRRSAWWGHAHADVQTHPATPVMWFRLCEAHSLIHIW